MAGTKYPEFDPPDAYILPEGLKEGETFEDIATFKLKPSGQICIIKVGDAPLLDNGKKEDQPEDYGTAEGMGNRLSEAYKNRA
jgi:hypothetical protein